MVLQVHGSDMMTQELLLQPLLEQPQNAVPQSTILLFFSKTYCILLIILQLIFSFIFFSVIF